MNEAPSVNGQSPREVIGGHFDATSPTEQKGWRFSPISSSTFAADDSRPEWLASRLLVKGQPAVVGGPSKVLKTSLVVDLVASLGSGTPFLGRFETYKPRRCALLSGESGQFTLRETALRICTTKGIELADVDCLWQFDLPQLGNAAHVNDLAAGLAEKGVTVCVMDPLYLSLLAGGDVGADASRNVYAIGPLLLGISQACLRVGCTPIFCHHATKAIPVGDPMELSHLSGAGIAEFARQWLLLNRRERYTGDGRHSLWLSAGGSCGQGGLWSVRIDEGTIGEEFDGRRWNVEIEDSATAFSNEAERRQQEKEARGKERDEKRLADDAERLLRAIDELCRERSHTKLPPIAPIREARHRAGLSQERSERAAQRLLSTRTIIEREYESPSGRGGKTVVARKGYRRVDDPKKLFPD